MPTYNDDKYIKQAIEDILNQTYENFELLIIDDGSTDSTKEIVTDYASQDNRVSYHYKENGGTGSALNYGFNIATGVYGTWVSSDDRRPSHCIERLVAALRETGAELAFASYHSEKFNRSWRSYILDKETGQFSVNPTPFYHDLRPTRQTLLVNNWVDINFYMCHSGVSFMFTMDLKNRSGDYLNLPGEDYHMEVKMAILAKNNQVAYIDEVLGWHRSPPDSLTNTDPLCVLEAEKITKNMILDWKKKGALDA